MNGRNRKQVREFIFRLSLSCYQRLQKLDFLLLFQLPRMVARSSFTCYQRPIASAGRGLQTIDGNAVSVGMGMRMRDDFWSTHHQAPVLDALRADEPVG